MREREREKVDRYCEREREWGREKLGILVLEDPKEEMRQKNKISLMKLRFESEPGKPN